MDLWQISAHHWMHRRIDYLEMIIFRAYASASPARSEYDETEVIGVTCANTGNMALHAFSSQACQGNSCLFQVATANELNDFLAENVIEQAVFTAVIQSFDQQLITPDL